MRIPFTTEQFLDVFRRYNEAVWPMQWLLYALGVACIVLALRGTPRAGRIVGAILATLWCWTGAAYFLAFFLTAFRAINPFSATFGALFIAQAALFAWFGAWRGRLTFRARRDGAGWAGALLFIERGRNRAGRGLLAKLGFGPYLVDPIGFVMSKKMLRTIKRLAEEHRSVRTSALFHARLADRASRSA